MPAELREECGVVGIFNDPDAANLAYLSLYALQHRGQEACGIVALGGTPPLMLSHKSFGLVADAFSKETIAKLPGNCAIGHVRYSTQGGHRVQNIQPFYFESTFGPIAIAHNGNLTNARQLRADLEATGSIFQSTSDSEIFLHLLAKSRARDLAAKIVDVTQQIEGAYSLAILSSHGLFAVRDPFGFRPLVLGKRNQAFVVASETCALDLIDATYERDVEPGELLAITSAAVSSVRFRNEKQTAFCAFEPIYFARPDSRVFGSVMYTLRKRMGTELAIEAPADADMVIAVPDSGVPMAAGFAQQVGLPLETGLVRNHYIGRTFIEPSQAIRDFGVRLKLNPVPELLEGKRVIVVDDSIVRGTTSAKIIRMLKSAGAKEIHMRVGSPPITHSCFYGVDTPERKNLLAAQLTVAEICAFVGADSLAFLSHEGLKRALGTVDTQRYCLACFTGRYPERIHADVPAQPTDKGGPGFQTHTK